MTADLNSFDKPYNMSGNQGSILTRSSSFYPAEEQLDAEKIYGINNQMGMPPQALSHQGSVQLTQDSLSAGESPHEFNQMPALEAQPNNQNSTANSNSAENNINPISEIQSIYNRSFDSGFTNEGNISTINLSGLTALNSEKITNLNEFLKTQIGRRVTVDFLIGTETIISKSGYLVASASDFIAINEINTNDITTCDFSNIKFIRFYY